MTSMKNLKQLYGPWAVVTGASGGIGAAFVRLLAASGFSVILISRRLDAMQTLCSEIATSHPDVQTKVIAVDLTSPNMLDTIAEQVSGLDIGLLVNNAGIESSGAFLNMDEHSRDQVIAVNITAFTSITHFFGKLFVARTRVDKAKRAGMIFMSSMTAFIAPYMAVYGASKSFVSNLGMTLRAEWECDRVDVSVIEAGLVDTDMAERAEEVMGFQKAGNLPMEANLFVKYAMNAFLGGKGRFTPGVRNRIQLFVSSLLPQTAMNRIVAGIIWKSGSKQQLKYEAEENYAL